MPCVPRSLVRHDLVVEAYSRKSELLSKMETRMLLTLTVPLWSRWQDILDEYIKSNKNSSTVESNVEYGRFYRGNEFWRRGGDSNPR